MLIAVLITSSLLLWTVIGLTAHGLLKPPIDSPSGAAKVFGVIGGLIALAGYIYLYDKGSLVLLTRDFYANVSIDFISIAITVLIIDKLNEQRSASAEKTRILRQMASHSNDFARDAVRIIRDNKWFTEKDKSLEGLNFSKADLENAFLEEFYLAGCNFEDANLKSATLFKANLQGANLKSANLEGTILLEAKLDGALLEMATYDEDTKTGGFDLAGTGAVLVEKE